MGVLCVSRRTMKTAFRAACLVVGLARAVAADSTLAASRNETVHVWAPDKVEGRLVAFERR